MKYLEYIKENVNKEFKPGDKVIFDPSPGKKYYEDLRGSVCEIKYLYSKGDKKDYAISPIESKSNITIIVSESEISPYNETENYIENQFKNKNVNADNIKIGSTVSVTGKVGTKIYNGDIGFIKKISADNYLIEFEENDAKNTSNHTNLIDKDMVELVDVVVNIRKKDIVKTMMYEKGDAIKCIDKNSSQYGKIGHINKQWPKDGSYLVDFIDGNSTHMVFMREDQLAPSTFDVINRRRNVDTQNTTKTDKINIPIGSEEEEEEEEGDEISVFNKEDLVEFSYKDFLLEEKITTKENLLIIKSKCDNEINDPNLNKMKRIYYERTLKTIDIIKSYFDFLENKISKGLPVLRTVESIENEDLLKTKTKVRASDSKELTNKYSFDQGIIAYWIFKDALVFKTI